MHAKSSWDHISQSRYTMQLASFQQPHSNCIHVISLLCFANHIQKQWSLSHHSLCQVGLFSSECVLYVSLAVALSQPHSEVKHKTSNIPNAALQFTNAKQGNSNIAKFLQGSKFNWLFIFLLHAIFANSNKIKPCNKVS